MADDSSAEAQLAELRSTLEAAKETDGRDRENHLKAALAECLELRAWSLPHGATLQRHVSEALVAPDEERGYWLNRCLDEVDSTERQVEEHGRLSAPEQTASASKQMGDEPPADVRWIDEDTGVVELECSRPLLEWIELEADDETATEWVRRVVHAALRERLADCGATAEVTVDVPEAFARRVGLFAADQGIEPGSARLAEFATNHLRWRQEWTVDGQSWDLLEGEAHD